MADDPHETPTPWIRERPPWVAEPSPTGRAILRQWLEAQLAMVSTRRRRRGRRRRR